MTQPAEPREVVLVVDAARARGRALLRKQENEVDVGGEVELAAAELAHAEHDERLRFAGRVARLTIRAHQVAVRVLDGRGDGGIGEGAGVGQGLRDRGPAREVAPGDAHHLARTLAPQRRHEPGEIRLVAPRRHSRAAAISPRASGRSSAASSISHGASEIGRAARLMQTKSLAVEHTRQGLAQRGGTPTRNGVRPPDSRRLVSCCSQKGCEFRGHGRETLLEIAACRRRSTAYDWP